jgi:hypothetical protein
MMQLLSKEFHEHFNFDGIKLDTFSILIGGSSALIGLGVIYLRYHPVLLKISKTI